MERLGKYEVVEKIGEGGFGSVFKAHDPHLKRVVALKTCTSDDEGLKRRFLREGEIVASLQHPNITLVHDSGFEGGTPFLVQEFLSGEDLAERIARRDPLDDETRFRWLLGVARGLEYAHGRGVVHRDIKPANVRILADGTPKIMDFGIARLAQAETRLTRTGTAMGTIAYMSPEQLDGSDVDHRTDVFAFGVLAYELFSFTRPFDGETTSRIVYRILHEEPRRFAVATPALDPGLHEFLGRCLAKKPGDRFQSFTEIVAALESLRLGQTRLPAASSTAASMPATELLDPAAMAAAASQEFRRTTGATPQTTNEPASKRGRGLVVAAVLVLAALGGWWLLRRGERTAPAPGRTTESAAAGSAADLLRSLVEKAEQSARSARTIAESGGARELAPATFGDGEKLLAEGEGALAAKSFEAAHAAFLAASEAFERATSETARAAEAATVRALEGVSATSPAPKP